MPIRFYNTLSHSLETFAPADPPMVTMYNCGPTVYDFAHIGNFRAFVFADVLRRFLELGGYNVQQVMNITDVGHMTDDQSADGGGQDKMEVAATRIKEAKKQGTLPPGAIANPDDPYQIAEFYTQAFLEDARKLGLRIADDRADHRPRATQYVWQMQMLIRRLIATGHAYVAADGAVLYDVQSFPNYGKLSGNTLDKLRGGAGGRVQDEHQAAKRHPADFLLWKPDANHIMKWDSPWGVGYPGWHIECSAMSLSVLDHLAGKELREIDIHTGGEDNIFPHHECEIAQSCGATGLPSFARFWMHARFLLVEGKKMSKSKGNFFTVRDVLEGRASGKPVDPAVLRFELLKAHYRSNMNFTVKGLEDSASAVQRLRDMAGQLARLAGREKVEVDLSHPVLARFAGALSDDLNMSGALGELFGWLGEEHAEPPVALAVLRRIDSVLGVLGDAAAGGAAGTDTDSSSGMAPDIAARCAAIDAARKSKDFAAADRLRKELVAAGYDVLNTKAGTVAKKRLA